MAAWDGMTFESQGPDVMAMFGYDAGAWENEHNQALQAQGWAGPGMPPGSQPSQQQQQPMQQPVMAPATPSAPVRSPSPSVSAIDQWTPQHPGQGGRSIYDIPFEWNNAAANGNQFAEQTIQAYLNGQGTTAVFAGDPNGGAPPLANPPGSSTVSTGGTPAQAAILNQGTATTGIGPGGQVGQGITGAAGTTVNVNAGPNASQAALDDYYRQIAATQAATQAADAAYKAALIQHGNDQLAFDKAKQAYQETYNQKLLDIQQEQAGKQFGLAEAGVTGTYQGAPTLAAQTAHDQTALNLLQLGSQLRGPSNYFQYAQTLGNTPNGMRDLINGLAGRYQFASSPGATPGSQYEAASVGTLARDAAAGAPTSGVLAPGQVRAGGVGGIPQTPPALPAGNQWNARNFGIIAKNPTQLGLLQSAYDASGQDFGTAYSDFLASLPKYGFSGKARTVYA